MVKKISHIILFVLMMVSTLGFTITKHYCGEDLVDLSISGSVDSCCDMQGACCHDEAQTFQLDQDYTVPMMVNHVDYIAFVCYEIPVLLIESLQNNTTSTDAWVVGNAPPPKDVLDFLSGIQVYRL